MAKTRHYATLAIKFGHPDGMHPEAIEECGIREYAVAGHATDPSRCPLHVAANNLPKLDLDFQLARVKREVRAALAAHNQGDAERAIGRHACDADNWLYNLEVAMTKGNLRSAVFAALFLGVEWEQMRTRRFEPKVIQVNTTTRKLRKGAEQNAHAPEKKAEALKAYDRLMREKPDRKKTGGGGAYAKVKAETGIPVTTIRRWLRERREASI